MGRPRVRQEEDINGEETDVQFLNVLSTPRQMDLERGHLQLIKAELQRIIDLIEEMQTANRRRRNKLQ